MKLFAILLTFAGAAMCQSISDSDGSVTVDIRPRMVADAFVVEAAISTTRADTEAFRVTVIDGKERRTTLLEKATDGPTMWFFRIYRLEFDIEVQELSRTGTASIKSPLLRSGRAR